MQQELVSVLAKWPFMQTQTLLIAVHQHISIDYFENDCQLTCQTRIAVPFLALMSQANDQSKIVPCSEFYLDIVNSEDFDLRLDYMKWKQSQDDFSFCRYPFVYDPASKADILAAENTGTMRDQFQDAIFESIFGGGSCPFLVLRVSHQLLLQIHKLCANVCNQACMLLHQHQARSRPDQTC